MVQPDNSRELPPIWRAWIGKLFESWQSYRSWLIIQEDTYGYQKRIRKSGYDDFRHCVEKHSGSSCSAFGSELPRRLLDLTSRDTEDTDVIKLVETDRIEIDKVKGSPSIQYAALSYCWGSGTALKTTARNLNEHLTAGLRVSDMPRTLSGAVNVARDLQIQYLWIDALCILQYQESDPEVEQAEAQNDWNHESVRMHAIYGNAWLTIVAAGAAQCNEGLYMIDPTFPDHGDQPLFYRAWTLQEWLLSKRLLVFASGDVYYFCSKSAVKDTSRSYKHADIVLKQLGLRASPLMSDPARDKHDHWLKIIVNFSCRILSSRLDKLPAISGVAQKFCSEMGWSNTDYVAGLWKGETLIKDLTWAVSRLDSQSTPGHRWRRPGLPEDSLRPVGAKEGLGMSVETSRAPGRAPSWSWASMDGLIEFGNYSSTQDLAIVLSCETRPADEGNYFGQATSGTLVLNCSCYMKVLCYKYESRDFRLTLRDENQVHCAFQADDPSELDRKAFSRGEGEGEGELPKDKKLYCLGLYKEIHTFTSTWWTGIYGIVVEFDDELDAYVRLGMAYWQTDIPRACEVKSFKIV